MAVTLPTALPTDISTFPCLAAITETIISGMVVATLTIVAPTISFGIPLTSAIQDAASTNQPPPWMMRIMPAIKIAIISKRSIFDFLFHWFAAAGLL